MKTLTGIITFSLFNSEVNAIYTKTRIVLIHVLRRRPEAGCARLLFINGIGAAPPQNRITTSFAADIARPATLNVFGDIKLHDTARGLRDREQSTNLKMYGCIFYFNG